MKNLFALFLAISASTIPSKAFAGAWLQDEGRGVAITSTRFYGTTQFIDNHGDRKKIPLFTKTELSPYFEYGVTPSFTLGGEFSVAASTNAGRSTQQQQLNDSFDFQLSYGNIFGRSYLFRSSDFVVSVEPGIDFPYRINPDLTSDGDHPIPQIKLNFGYGYQRWELNNFIDGSVQYRYRNLGNLNDMIKSDLTIGYHITDYFVGLAQVTNEKTLGSTRSSGNYNLTKPQLSILYDEHEHVAQQFGVFTNIDGRNTGAGYGAIYSVWYRF